MGGGVKCPKYYVQIFGGVKMREAQIYTRETEGKNEKLYLVGGGGLSLKWVGFHPPPPTRGGVKISLAHCQSIWRGVIHVM